MLKNKTLSRIKETVYENAVRLFVDACCLCEHASYPSSYYLSLISIEEIGKLHMVDHICDDIILNKDRRGFLIHLFSRDMFYSHKNKQGWAACEFHSGIRKQYQKFFRKSIDRRKQRAIYVDYDRKRKKIMTPGYMSRKAVVRALKVNLHLLREVKDLGYNGFQCISTAATIRKAEKKYNEALFAFELCLQRRRV